MIVENPAPKFYLLTAKSKSTKSRFTVYVPVHVSLRKFFISITVIVVKTPAMTQSTLLSDKFKINLMGKDLIHAISNLPIPLKSL